MNSNNAKLFKQLRLATNSLLTLITQNQTSSSICKISVQEPVFIEFVSKLTAYLESQFRIPLTKLILSNSSFQEFQDIFSRYVESLHQQSKLQNNLLLVQVLLQQRQIPQFINEVEESKASLRQQKNLKEDSLFFDEDQLLLLRNLVQPLQTKSVQFLDASLLQMSPMTPTTPTTPISSDFASNNTTPPSSSKKKKKSSRRVVTLDNEDPAVTLQQSKSTASLMDASDSSTNTTNSVDDENEKYASLLSSTMQFPETIPEISTPPEEKHNKNISITPPKQRFEERLMTPVAVEPLETVVEKEVIPSTLEVKDDDIAMSPFVQDPPVLKFESTTEQQKPLSDEQDTQEPQIADLKEEKYEEAAQKQDDTSVTVVNASTEEFQEQQEEEIEVDTNSKEDITLENKISEPIEVDDSIVKTEVLEENTVEVKESATLPEATQVEDQQNLDIDNVMAEDGALPENSDVLDGELSDLDDIEQDPIEYNGSNIQDIMKEDKILSQEDVEKLLHEEIPTLDFLEQNKMTVEDIMNEFDVELPVDTSANILQKEEQRGKEDETVHQEIQHEHNDSKPVEENAKETVPEIKEELQVQPQLKEIRTNFFNREEYYNKDILDGAIFSLQRKQLDKLNKFAVKQHEQLRQDKSRTLHSFVKESDSQLIDVEQIMHICEELLEYVSHQQPTLLKVNSITKFELDVYLQRLRNLNQRQSFMAQNSFTPKEDVRLPTSSELIIPSNAFDKTLMRISALVEQIQNYEKLQSQKPIIIEPQVSNSTTIIKERTEVGQIMTDTHASSFDENNSHLSTNDQIERNSNISEDDWQMLESVKSNAAASSSASISRDNNGRSRASSTTSSTSKNLPLSQLSENYSVSTFELSKSSVNIKFMVDLPTEYLMKKTELLALQHYKCAQCEKLLKKDYWIKSPKRCSYTGKFYCLNCMKNDTAVIPSFVLEKWDFKLRPVSVSAKQFLDDISEMPTVIVSAINPSLFEKVENLKKARMIRNRIVIQYETLQQCPQLYEVETKLKLSNPSVKYLLENTETFSMKDLIGLSSPKAEECPFLEKLSILYQELNQHIIYQCSSCRQRARHICPACQNRSEPIYPFQLNLVRECPNCKNLFHKNCFVTDNKVCCPICSMNQ